MKLFVFEGTPEEISRATSLISGISSNLSPSVEEGTDPETSPSAQEAFVTRRFARRVLTRRQLSGGLTSLFDALCEAYPDWVPLADLHEATGFSPAEFAGLSGAFGRRIVHTPGYDGELVFIAKRRDDDGEREYRLPESVYEAYQELKS